MIMEYSKTVLVFCIYTLIETRALPTTIDDTNQSQNVIKQADQETATETNLVNVNAEILQDDFYQNIKKSSTNESVEHKKRGRCGCRNTANGANTDKNEKMMIMKVKSDMKMKSDNYNGQESNNCQHKKRGNPSGRRNKKGEAGKRGPVTFNEENKESGNEQTESSNYLTTVHNYEADNNKPQNGDKSQKEQSKPDGNKTGEKEGQKEESIPEKFKDALKKARKQIINKN